MRITVTLEVDVDLDAWQTEYGNASAAHAMKEALDDLRNPEAHLTGPKWEGLAAVASVQAIVDLDRQPAR